jgi:hypothetical protein
MTPTPLHLEDLEEIEREGVPGLVEVLREGASTAFGTPCGTPQGGIGTTPLPPSGETALQRSRRGKAGK